MQYVLQRATLSLLIDEGPSELESARVFSTNDGFINRGTHRWAAELESEEKRLEKISGR